MLIYSKFILIHNYYIK